MTEIMNKPPKRARQLSLFESWQSEKNKAIKLNLMDDKAKSDMRECLASAAEKRIKELQSLSKAKNHEKDCSQNKINSLQSININKKDCVIQKDLLQEHLPSSSNQKDFKFSNHKKGIFYTESEDIIKENETPTKNQENESDFLTEPIEENLSSQSTPPFSQDLFPNDITLTPNSAKEDSLNIPESAEKDFLKTPSLEKKNESPNSIKKNMTKSFELSLMKKNSLKFTTSSCIEESIKIPKVSELLRLPNCSATLPPLTASSSHTILFRPHIREGCAPRPYPDEYRDKWDEDHVRMPCSSLNRYPVIFPDGQKVIQSRWELICDSLRQKIESSIDLENAIMQYNSQYSNRWNFSGLHSFLNKHLKLPQRNYFFEVILPGMVHLALQLPQICTQPIPLLKKNMDHTITLSQKQIGCLLANAFFCTFPRRNCSSKYQRTSEYSSYPNINFNRLFYGTKNGISKCNAEKLKCLLNYFLRITIKDPCGTVSFHRKCNKIFPNWEMSDSKLKKVVICSDGLIETEGSGMLQVDFANSFVGGGVIGHGCVQEEIRFVICPELLVSMLFTEQLADSEALLVTGVEQYNDYTGYGDTFEWNGDYQDNTPRDAWGRKYTQVVAIDALLFQNSNDQFKLNLIKRELNKAYVGFSDKNTASTNLPAIATGNWGCGAFKGYPNLKFLIQLMAASQAERDILYFTFGNKKLQQVLQNMYNFLIKKELTVGQLWKLFTDYCNDCMPFIEEYRPTLYEYIYCVHKELKDEVVSNSVQTVKIHNNTEEIEEYTETTDTE